MGQLPSSRMSISRPFHYTGVDYPGPIQVKCSKGMGMKSQKGWIAIFICLTTRAVHIEIVSDLTPQTFLAAFQRFAARRGLPHTMYSDNGTTFQGADKELQDLFQRNSEFLSSTIKEKLK